MSPLSSALTRCLALLFLFHAVPAQAAQQIYFTAGNATAANDALLKVNADGTGQTTVASGAASFSQPESVAIDPAAGYVFVTDGNGGQKILRFNLDGTGRTVVYDVASDGNTGFPRSIALDRVNQRIYFTTISNTAADDRLMRLSSYNAGAAATTLLSGSSNFASPAGMALDLARGYIYINDSTTLSSQGLLRFNLDGTGRTVIASNATLFPGGSGLGGQVAVEPASGDLFVCLTGSTASDDRLIRVTDPGSGNTISTIASGATNFTQPYGLTLDPQNSYLYVGDNNPSGPQALLRFKLDGTGRTVIGNTPAAGSPVNGVALLTPDYAVTTTSTTITVTDLTGNGDTLTVTQPSAGNNISFAAPGRAFSLNGGANLSGSSGSLPLTGITKVSVNAAGGDDTVTFSGNITFPSGTSLDVNLQDDGGTVGADNITFAANAVVALSGTGGATLKASRNILFNTGSSLTTVNGAITVEANQQATATTGSFYGADISGTLQATGTGTVTVNVRGGDVAGGNVGLMMRSGGAIKGGSSGAVLVNATGGAGGNSAYGISMNSGVIRSTGASVSVTGQGGGTGAAINGRGIQMEGDGLIAADGAGSVTVTGIAGPGTGGGYSGIGFYGSSSITAAQGAVLVTGTGGGAGSDAGNQFGIAMGGGSISASGPAGSVSLRGTGGIGGDVNHGIFLSGSASVTSGGGDISIEGTAGTGTRSVGIAAYYNPSAYISTLANGGNIMLTADSIALDTSGATTALITAPSGAAVTLRPKTAGRPIQLRGQIAPDALRLADAQLDRISTGTLVIGDSAAGSITVTTDITRAAATNMQLISGADITFTTGHIDTGGGTLLLDAGSTAAVKPGVSGTDVTTGATSALSFGSGGALSLDISGNTVDTGYQQLKVAGKVNLTGTILKLTGGYTPLAGDSFTLVDNDGADAITGTFSRADGSSIANGSTVNFNDVPLKILYNGGDGNDVVLIGLPTITSISPASGSIFGGQSVTITGTNLTGVSRVTFGGTDATLGTNTATSIVVTTPTGSAGARDVVVTTSGGSVTSAGGYTYIDLPAVTGISPASGSTAGGTVVTLTGTNFTGATGVTIGGAAATGVTVVNATSITATTPSGTVGGASVVVTTPGGSNAANTLYTYAAPPTITSISPASGSIFGGQSVTITGTNLAGVSRVTFGGTDATLGTNTATSIVVTTPTGSAGARDVVVTTPGGSVTSAGGYTYIDLPAVTGISPASGSTAGGTVVTLTGTNFTGATGVTIGGAAATGVTVVNATSITATTPAGTAGSASVVVTTPVGSNKANTLYTYIAPPTVAGISPASGPVAGGTVVSITGTGFTGATGVTIGGKAATAVSVVNSTTITATTPSGTAGSASVVVTTPGGSNAANTLYTYAVAPTIISISPASGSIFGGQSVTITGANLAGVTKVTFGGANATLGANTATSIVVTTPTGTAGARDVVVTTPGGSAISAGGYTYIDLPTVTGISPASGSTAGGTVVTLTGTNFTGATGVTIGGAAATAVSVVNSTSITAITPSGTAGSASVMVTTPVGSNKANTLYTYVVPNTAPTLAGIPSVSIPLNSPEQKVPLTGITPGGGADESAQTLGVSAVSSNTALIASPVTIDYTSPAKSGTLRFTPVAGASGSTDITVTVKDSGGTANGGVDTFTRIFTVTVTAPDIAVSGGGNAIPSGDTTPSPTDGTAFGSVNVFSGTATKTYDIRNNGNGDLLITGATLSGAGAADYSVTTAPSASVSPGGTTSVGITFNPSATGASPASVNIATNDPDTASYTFSITGSGFDNPPSSITLTPSSIAENNASKAVIGNLAANDADAAAGDTVTFALVTGAGDSNNDLFEIIGTQLRFKNVITRANFEALSSYRIRVSATDSVGGSTSQSLSISVINVNELPTFTLGANQTVTDGSTAPHRVPGWATGISDGDSTVAQALNFTVTEVGSSGLLTGLPTVSASTGDLAFTPSGHSGTATFSITLTDDDSINGYPALTTPPRTFTITVNRPPVAVDDQLGTSENIPATVIARKFTLNDRDPDGDAISITGVSPASAHGSVSLNTAGRILYVPATGYSGPDSFTYTLTDAWGATATGTVNVTVSPKDAGSQNSVITPTAEGYDLQFSGIPGKRYTIQYSPDLTSGWQTLAGPLTADKNGALHYSDNTQPRPASRFYRTISADP